MFPPKISKINIKKSLDISHIIFGMEIKEHVWMEITPGFNNFTP
jgi:hypothetical protein